jgi:hypothetical protein
LSCVDGADGGVELEADVDAAVVVVGVADVPLVPLGTVDAPAAVVDGATPPP